MSPKTAVLIWTLFVAGVTYALTLAFVAPRQAAAREEVPMPSIEVEAPTLLATCETAAASARALHERLEGIVGGIEDR